MIYVSSIDKAIEYVDNTNGLHRKDGPALEFPDGSKYWYQRGLLHRVDGPAVELPFRSSWYIEGRKIERK